ncbi:hypothetical protein ACJX0J_015384, partial [Zea mays]
NIYYIKGKSLLATWLEGAQTLEQFLGGIQEKRIRPKDMSGKDGDLAWSHLLLSCATENPSFKLEFHDLTDIFALYASQYMSLFFLVSSHLVIYVYIIKKGGQDGIMFLFANLCDNVLSYVKRFHFHSTKYSVLIFLFPFTDGDSATLI